MIWLKTYLIKRNRRNAALNKTIVTRLELVTATITIDGKKTIPCMVVLRLMDSEHFSNNYCKALNVILEIFPEIDRERLEKEAYSTNTFEL